MKNLRKINVFRSRASPDTSATTLQPQLQPRHSRYIIPATTSQHNTPAQTLQPQNSSHRTSATTLQQQLQPGHSSYNAPATTLHTRHSSPSLDAKHSKHAFGNGDWISSTDGFCPQNKMEGRDSVGGFKGARVFRFHKYLG